MEMQEKTAPAAPDYKDLTDMIAGRRVTRDELLSDPTYFAELFPYEDYFDFLAIAACAW